MFMALQQRARQWMLVSSDPHINPYVIEACVSEIIFPIKNFLRKCWIMSYATSSFYAVFLGLIVMQIPD